MLRISWSPSVEAIFVRKFTADLDWLAIGWWSIDRLSFNRWLIEIISSRFVRWLNWFLDWHDMTWHTCLTNQILPKYKTCLMSPKHIDLLGCLSATWNSKYTREAVVQTVESNWSILKGCTTASSYFFWGTACANSNGTQNYLELKKRNTFSTLVSLPWLCFLKALPSPRTSIAFCSLNTAHQSRRLCRACPRESET